MKRIVKRVLALVLAVCLCGGIVALAAEVDVEKDTVAKVQQALNDAGYDCGTPDGVAGKKTAAAIEQYQTDKGLTVTGSITSELLKSLGIRVTRTAGQGSVTRMLLRAVKGPVYTSSYNYDELRGAPRRAWNMRVKVIGTADDLSGAFPMDKQREQGLLLVRSDVGDLYAVECADAAAEVPECNAGDEVTVSGSVEGNVSAADIPELGEEEALRLRADLIQRGSAPAPNAVTLRRYQEQLGWEARTSDFVDSLVESDSSYDISTMPLYEHLFDSAGLVTGGKVTSVVDGSFAASGGDVKNGWVQLESTEDGLGAAAPLVNYSTGMTIYGCEGAEVELCDEGILQFEWRDAETGLPVDVETVFHCHLNGEEFDASTGAPRNFQLYAKYYDLDGNFVEERQVSDYREDEPYDADKFEAPKQQLREEYGAHPASAGTPLEFVELDSCAIAFDESGEVLVRYPYADPAELHGVYLADQGVVSVSYDGYKGESTEIFVIDPFDDSQSSESAPESEIPENSELDVHYLIAQNMPKSTYAASDGSGEVPPIRIVGVVDPVSNDPEGRWDWLPYDEAAQVEDQRVYFVSESGVKYSAGLQSNKYGVDFPGYPIGSTITVVGWPSFHGSLASGYETFYTGFNYIGTYIYPVVFIGAGDVPWPQE